MTEIIQIYSYNVNEIFIIKFQKKVKNLETLLKHRNSDTHTPVTKTS